MGCWRQYFSVFGNEIQIFDKLSYACVSALENDNCCYFCCYKTLGGLKCRIKSSFELDLEFILASSKLFEMLAEL